MQRIHVTPGKVRRTLTSVVTFAACTLLWGARREPAFLHYDAEARRADLTITAGYDQSNSGFNLNGASYGAHRITVPVGWKVTITFINRDKIPHSVGVVREEARLPTRIVRPVFAGAASRAIERGLPAGARQDDIAFVAERPGAYLLACGVPGHAAVGSYLRFAVSAEATIPTYETAQTRAATVLPGASQ